MGRAVISNHYREWLRRSFAGGLWPLATLTHSSESFLPVDVFRSEQTRPRLYSTDERVVDCLWHYGGGCCRWWRDDRSDVRAA